MGVALRCLLVCCCLAMATVVGCGEKAEQEMEKMEMEKMEMATEERKERGRGWPGYLYTRPAGTCTPQFWSSGREAWPNIVHQEAAVSKVFGSRMLERYEPTLTLLEAIERNDDVGGSVYAKLVKQGSTALLNAYARPGFPYDSWEVKTLLLEALVSEESAASQAEHFEQANQVCT